MKRILKIFKCIFGANINNENNNKYIEKSDLPFKSVAEFINHATHDYIASRILLLQGIPGPGTIQAVTALEKIMKSYLLELGLKVRRDGRGHNLVSLMTELDKYDNNYLSTDERKFIHHINSAYLLRYPTEINPTFETFLPANKVLANLDSLFCKFIESNVLDPISKGAKWYDMFKNGSMPKVQLLTKNVYFGQDRKALIESNQWYVAYYKSNQGNVSLFRTTDIVKDDNNWKVPETLKS